MSILITGGAGYIGSHTTVELLNAGFDVVLADDFSNSSPAVLERLEKITGKKFPFYQGRKPKRRTDIQAREAGM